MTINIIWLLMNSFTIVTLDMDSALHVEYLDVVLCGVFVALNKTKKIELPHVHSLKPLTTFS